MLFNYTPSELAIKDSYKERNLYCKIFAGYFFNEIVPGIEKRKQDFVNKIFTEIRNDERYSGSFSAIQSALQAFMEKENKMTFDFHPCQINSTDFVTDRGEMSDILIVNDSHFISIEFKFLEQMAYRKDVTEVQNRMISFSDFLKLNPLQILLMKRSSWQNGSIRSEIKIFKPKIPLVIVLWEDMLEIITDHRVKEYLRIQLTRKKN